MMEELGSILGVRFFYQRSRINGFVLMLTEDNTPQNIEDYTEEYTEKVLFEARMIGYSLWEAVVHACWEVWKEEIEEHKDEELPARIAGTLGIIETYFDDEPEEPMDYNPELDGVYDGDSTDTEQRALYNSMRNDD